MAPSSSHDVPRNQRGRFDCQRSDGSVVINVSSGFGFVIRGASVASTGMGRLLAEGLKQNESLYWTTRSDFEGPEIDQFYCDRIDNPPQRLDRSKQGVMCKANDLAIVDHTPIIMSTMEAAVLTA